MRLPVNHARPIAALILLGASLAACGGGGGGSRPQPAPIAANGPAADYPVVVGDPFVIDGVTHTPTDKLNFDTVGYATAGQDGGNGVSIAHKTLPMPSYAEVTALDSGKTILVRVERRGPMTNDRIVDLSPGAAEQLGLTGADKAPVRIRRVNPPEVERAMLRGGNRAPSRMDTPQSLLAVLRRKLDAAAAPVAPALGLPPVDRGPSTTVSPTPAASPSASASPALPAKATPAPRATQSPRAAAAARPTPSPRATPAPRPASPPAPSPSPSHSPAAAGAPAAAGHFVVQVGVFSVQQNARQTASRLGGQSLEAGRMWRVRMGPFATRAQAADALARAKRAGFRDARIDRAD